MDGFQTPQNIGQPGNGFFRRYGLLIAGGVVVLGFLALVYFFFTFKP